MGQFVFIPISTRLGVRIHDACEYDGDPKFAALEYEFACGFEGRMKSVGCIEGASCNEVGVADVDDEESGVWAEGKTAG